MSFKKHDLQIDNLSFNIQDKAQINCISDYLATYFACSTFYYDKSTKERFTLASVKPHTCVAQFNVNEVSGGWWNGCTLRFNGKHALRFYNLVKTQGFDASIFNTDKLTLGRIDLKYDYLLLSNDPSAKRFLQEVDSCLQSKDITSKMSNQLLRVWTRKNTAQYFRAYVRSDGKNLRFELELKRDLAKAYQHSFFRQDFAEFEQCYTQLFYNKIARIFKYHLNHTYLSPFVDNLRKLRSYHLDLTHSFLVTYLSDKYPTINNHSYIENFYTFVQLVNYLKLLDPEQLNDSLNLTYFTFPLNDFIRQTKNVSPSPYQFKKYKAFFNSLTSSISYTQNFSDEEFKSSAVFPRVQFVKVKRVIFVELFVLPNLLTYTYPYQLPTIFTTYHDKYQLYAQTIFIQAMANTALTKKIDLTYIKTNYSRKSSLQIRKHLVLLFQEGQKIGIIETSLLIIKKDGQKICLENLTTNTLSRAEVILFKENFHFSNNYKSDLLLE